MKNPIKINFKLLFMTRNLCLLVPPFIHVLTHILLISTQGSLFSCFLFGFEFRLVYYFIIILEEIIKVKFETHYYYCRSRCEGRCQLVAFRVIESGFCAPDCYDVCASACKMMLTIKIVVLYKEILSAHSLESYNLQFPSFLLLKFLLIILCDFAIFLLCYFSNVIN